MGIRALSLPLSLSLSPSLPLSLSLSLSPPLSLSPSLSRVSFTAGERGGNTLNKFQDFRTEKRLTPRPEYCLEWQVSDASWLNRGAADALRSGLRVPGSGFGVHASGFGFRGAGFKGSGV